MNWIFIVVVVVVVALLIVIIVMDTVRRLLVLLLPVAPLVAAVVVLLVVVPADHSCNRIILLDNRNKSIPLSELSAISNCAVARRNPSNNGNDCNTS